MEVTPSTILTKFLVMAPFQLKNPFPQKTSHGSETKRPNHHVTSIRNVISNFGEFYHTSTSYTSMIYIVIFRGLLDPLAKRAGNSIKQAVTLLILNHLKALGFPVKFTPIHGKAFLIPILKEENTNEHSTQAHLFGVESSRRTACMFFNAPPWYYP